MTTSGSGKTEDTATLRLLHRVGLQHAEVAERAARLAFGQMRKELISGQAFGLAVDFADREPRFSDDLYSRMDHQSLLAETANLPQLDVPLGHIAWAGDTNMMPVVGIFCEAEKDSRLTEDMLHLLSEHHRNPFAKFLFICETLTPLPFLGRYGFAAHYLSGQSIEDAVEILNGRFGVSQIRRLNGAGLVWSSAPS